MMKARVKLIACFLAVFCGPWAISDEPKRPRSDPITAAGLEATFAAENDVTTAALNSKCTFRFEPAPLKSVLASIEKTGKIQIEVNTEDFKRQGIADVELQQVALPKLDNARVGRALQLILDEIGATYIVTDGRVHVGS